MVHNKFKGDLAGLGADLSLVRKAFETTDTSYWEFKATQEKKQASLLTEVNKVRASQDDCDIDRVHLHSEVESLSNKLKTTFHDLNDLRFKIELIVGKRETESGQGRLDGVIEQFNAIKDWVRQGYVPLAEHHKLAKEVTKKVTEVLGMKEWFQTAIHGLSFQGPSGQGLMSEHEQLRDLQKSFSDLEEGLA